MQKRTLAVGVLILATAVLAANAQQFEIYFSPHVYLLSGATYLSTEFDYRNAYIRYVRSHGTDAGFEDYYTPDKTEMELFIDTASLVIEGRAGEYVVGAVGGIYEASEDDEQVLQLDLAYISLLLKKFSLTLGRHYLDIAPFESQSVFHSWNRDLSETRADALTAMFNGFLIKLWGSVFEGEYPVNPKRNEKTIEDYAAGVELKPLAMREDIDLRLGASYLGDLCESKAGLGKIVTSSEPKTVLASIDTTGDGSPDTWVEIVVGEQENTYEKRVDLWTLYGGLDIALGPNLDTGIDIEYSFAGRSFKKTDLADSEGHEARPAAYNAELWVKIYDVLGIGARLQGTKDFDASSTGADEAHEFGPIVSFSLGDYLRTSAEYMRGEDSDRNTWNKAALGIELLLF